MLTQYNKICQSSAACPVYSQIINKNTFRCTNDTKCANLTKMLGSTSFECTDDLSCAPNTTLKIDGSTFACSAEPSCPGTQIRVGGVLLCEDLISCGLNISVEVLKQKCVSAANPLLFREGQNIYKLQNYTTERVVTNLNGTFTLVNQSDNFVPFMFYNSSKQEFYFNFSATQHHLMVDRYLESSSEC